MVKLQSVNGGLLTVEGKINLTFKIGGVKITHQVHVVSDMNRNMILGRDVMQTFGVRLYYDPNILRIKTVNVPFE